MKEQYITNIIEAIKLSNPSFDESSVNETTPFASIPGMDSMSIVNFQIDLASIIGEKANEILPIPEMTIGELAELLESI